MTPDRIEFWKNNTTPAYKLTKRLFRELSAIEPTDLLYQESTGNWCGNPSAPCETDSLVYRLRPDYVEPQNETDDSLGIKNDKQDDKLPMELIPPEVIIGYAEVMRMGAKKYAPRNWEKGLHFSRLYAAAFRHLLLWYGGENLDKESGLNHLKHCLWNIGALIHFIESGQNKLDDRPNYKGTENAEN